MSRPNNEIAFDYNNILTLAEHFVPMFTLLKEYSLAEKNFISDLKVKYDGDAKKEFENYYVDMYLQTKTLIDTYEALYNTIIEIIDAFDQKDEEIAQRIRNYEIKCKENYDKYSGDFDV